MDKETEIFLTLQDQGRLLGILHLPSKIKRPCPAVIYCPGINGERYEVHRLAVKLGRFLAERGIAFLRFDYYGIGLSDGYYYEMTNSTKISNALCALEYLRSRPDIDLERCAFLGFSDGARIALTSAVRSGVNRLIMWSPILWEMSLPTNINRKNRFFLHPKFNKIMKAWIGLWIGIDYFRDLEQYKIDEQLEQFSGTCLQIYGEDDPIAKETWNRIREQRAALADDRNTIRIVADAGHLFTSKILEQVLIEETYAWLSRSFSMVQPGGEKCYG